MKKLFLLVCLFSSFSILAQNVSGISKDAFAHTFSIVARDTTTGEMAVGVQSHWFSVGSIVSWGRSGVGVVATQSFVNPAYGPEGLDLMAKGIPADEALARLVENDEGRAFRQVAFLDVNGNVSAFTGEKCVEAAEDVQGKNFSVQANMMLNDKVVPAMAEAFVRFSDLPLAERVVKAMEAGQEAGGDIRGKQSAALIVVGPQKTSKSWEDKKIDLRVDDHTTPVKELGRLLKVHRAYEHMNKGDLAVEANDMEKALQEYGAAEKMFPDNLEMQYWKAVALANSGRMEEATPIFKKIFAQDDNWREMTRRLPASGLLTISKEELEQLTQ
ncbi:DUF1028 domain-containing protein [Christiangramia aquimixticola]|uniref:DUF1028 domain-containing protein n=1 Tax=Christiangramia aquimixticola TaxID=1697558 RepID=UPI003AA91F9A